MIWSSAQPHSVQAMLEKCFPTQHKPHRGTGERDASKDDKSDDRFIAVWARDTLGLSRFDYCQCFQFYPIFCSDMCNNIRLSRRQPCILWYIARKTPTTKDLHKPWKQLRPVSGPDKKSVAESSLPGDLSMSDQVLRHSARTTVLLDDSPRKAYLQPWNHVCLTEYDGAARHRDLKILQDTPQKMPKERIDNGTFDDVLHTTENLPSIAPPARTTELYQHSFDTTLLAIIGILEAVKHETNVAGWIRGNGLRAEGQLDTSKMSVSHGDARPVASSTKRPQDDGSDADILDSRAKSKPIKRRRLHKSSQHNAKDSLADSLDLSPDLPNSSDRFRISKTHDTLGTEAKHSSEKHADNVLQHLSSKDDKTASADTPACWFSHAPTFAHWVSRGRDALARLGIDERHGVSAEEL